MNERIEFGDLILVRNRGWEIAVRDKGAIISIITPPPPTMDGSGVISYWGVKRADIEDHLCAAAVPEAIAALERLEMTAGQPAMYDDPVRVHARDALRALSGEETA